MKKRTVMLVLGCFLSITLLLPSSAPAAGPKGQVTFAATTGAGWESWIDPHTDIPNGSVITVNLAWDSFVTKDANGKYIPSLAESWEIAEDWSKMDFYLKKGVKFHNGEPCTAEDVAFSLNRLMRDGCVHFFNKEMNKNIDRVEIVDDYHVRIHLKAPYPGFLQRSFENMAIVPKDYIEKVGDEGFAAKPIGTGPFKIVEFNEAEEYIKFEAVQDHHRQTPSIKTLIFKRVPEATPRLAMLKTGEADVVHLDAAHIPAVNKDPNLRIVWGKYNNAIDLTVMDLIHPEASPWKDERVRLAASLAVDREVIADRIFHGSAEPWGSYLPPYMPGYDPTYEPDPYDPERAKKLLAEAGYPDGFDTVVTSAPYTKTWIEPVVAQLAEVGIRAKLELVEIGTFVDQCRLGKLKGLAWMPIPWWAGRDHPGVAWISTAVSGWTVAVATQEMKDAVLTVQQAVGEEAIAAEARKTEKLFQKLNQRILLWAAHNPFAVGPKIESLEPVPGMTMLVGFDRVTLAPER
jgi:peptide/nickel transport system substrate-binding protein